MSVLLPSSKEMLYLCIVLECKDMIVFPNAKINVGLNITSKRADGYHNLESVFYPIPLKDVLEIVVAEDGVTEMKIGGLAIDGEVSDNTVMKAYRLLKEEFDLPPVKIFMEKVIPFGAGLGGGSSDASFAIKLMNDMFHLDMDVAHMETIAAKIGADCPFFIQNKPSFVTGIGDVLQPIEFSLAGVYFLLVKPDDFVSTKEAYSKVVPKMPVLPLSEMVQKPISEWKYNVVNDFEESVFASHPTVKMVKDTMYEHDAMYASMSGSGSSVFGLFRSEVDAESLFPGMFTFQQKL